MIHGNNEDHTIFNEALNKLVKDYSVYTIDSRGHGLSSKVDEISYDLMAEDLKAFIIQNNLFKPIIYGFSDGGIIAVLIAIKYQELVSKIIISGANYNPSGLKLRTRLEILKDYLIKHSKLDLMMLKEPHISSKDLSSINLPVVIIVGSNDVITLSHTKRMHTLIQDSKLVILEGESHDSYIIHKERLADILLKYLN